MERDFAVYRARSSHNFSAERIRKKLVAETDAETLLTEAFEMVGRDIGPFPSEEHPRNETFLDDDEDEATERGMREIAMYNYNSLSETETYMWGLGIAGVVHQWERDSRVVIAAIAEKPPTREKLSRRWILNSCASRSQRQASTSNRTVHFRPAARLSHREYDQARRGQILPGASG